MLAAKLKSRRKQYEIFCKPFDLLTKLHEFNDWNNDQDKHAVISAKQTWKKSNL